MALIETTALRREFGETLAVDDIRLTVEKGSVFALVGPNGAGKTTLLRMIAALLEPTAGTAVVGGFDVRESPRLVHSCIGYLPDFFGLYENLTAREYLTYFHLAYRLSPDMMETRIGEVLFKVGLSDRIEAPIETLSRGMRQRLGLARTLLHDPELLLLDEPASGLDPGARHDLQVLLRSLARSGKTIVVSSHILSELEDYCSHVAMLDKGRLVFSGPISAARASLAQAKRYRLRVLGNASKARDLVLRHPHAKDWRADGAEWSFEFAGDEAAAADLLKILVDAGLSVSMFCEATGTIQESYLALLGRQTR